MARQKFKKGDLVCIIDPAGGSQKVLGIHPRIVERNGVARYPSVKILDVGLHGIALKPEFDGRVEVLIDGSVLEVTALWLKKVNDA